MIWGENPYFWSATHFKSHHQFGTIRPWPGDGGPNIAEWMMFGVPILAYTPSFRIKQHPLEDAWRCSFFFASLRNYTTIILPSLKLTCSPLKICRAFLKGKRGSVFLLHQFSGAQQWRIHTADKQSVYGGFLKWWVSPVSPTGPWVFLLKMISTWGILGVPPFKETDPYMYIIVYFLYIIKSNK